MGAKASEAGGTEPTAEQGDAPECPRCGSGRTWNTTPEAPGEDVGKCDRCGETWHFPAPRLSRAAEALLRAGIEAHEVEDVVMMMHGKNRMASVPGELVADEREMGAAECDRWREALRDGEATLAGLARSEGVLPSEVMLHARGVCTHGRNRAEPVDLAAVVGAEEDR